MNTILLIIGLLLLIISASVIGFIIRYRKDWFKRNKKKLAAVVVASTVLAGSGLLINPPEDIITATVAQSVWYHGSSTNSYYRTNTTQSFDLIRLNNSFVVFNTTVFKVSSTARVNVTIMYINDSGVTPTVTGRCLRIYSNVTAAETIQYIIGGFEADTHYLIKKNNTDYKYVKSNTTGFISFPNTFTSDDYYIKFDVYKGMTDITTIRTNGVDYFTWLGVNTSACYVKNNITGLNEASEYIAEFNNTGIWVKFNGDNTGTNWTVHTYDIIKTYMDDAVGGSTSFTITMNPTVDFDAPRAVFLTNKGNGYNYTGYTNITVDTSLSAINTILSPHHGYFCALWNRTTFTWNYWISGFTTINKKVTHYNVIVTKLDIDRTWTM